MKKTIVAPIAALAAGVALTGCGGQSDADVANHNLSKAADQFELNRRIVFYNGVTDQYMLTIEGRCSIKDEGDQLEVVCQTGPGEYKKHFLGLSDNVTYVAEQLDGANVSVDHYRVVFKPSTIVPDIEIR